VETDRHDTCVVVLDMEFSGLGGGGGWGVGGVLCEIRMNVYRR
jgi:hypothetical protein